MAWMTNLPLPLRAFRRVEEVCIVVDDAGMRAEVTGVMHRLPHTVQVPLSLALALIEAGVRRRVVDRRSPSAMEHPRAS